jgi:molybdopterin molybdotransferase
MEIEIHITNEPIPAQLPSSLAGGAGAWVEFRGVVRGEENGAAIAALEYEAYSPMAEREIRRIIAEISVAKPCLAARVIHRVGVIPVGEVAIYVGIAGKHRAEAFALLGEFMDRLKVDVPIWKRRAIAAAVVAQVSQPAVSPTSKSAGLGNSGGVSDGRDTASLETCATPRKANSPAGLDAVFAQVRSVSQPLEAERVELASAAGRMLREDVSAPEDQPAFDRSAVDGFAIRVDDPAQEFQIVDRLRAGDWRPRELAPGEAVQIATGGALPGDGLQVMMKEDVRVTGERVQVLRREGAGYIRLRGEDCRAGDVLVAAGTRLSAGGAGLLASLGAVRPLVTRLPRVLHLATGNEIVPPEQTPSRGQIRDSNSTLVRAFFEQWGVTPVQLRVGEDRGAIEAAMANSRWPMAEVDVLIISGGASVGEHDFTRGLLEQFGFTVHISKAATRPGKPLIVAQCGRTVAFGLPGNPLAHFVCLNLFVRASLEKMLGLPERNPFAPAVLAANLEGDSNARETLWPAVVGCEAGRMLATPLRWSSSGDLTCLAVANALLRVAPGTGLLLAGAEIPFATTLVTS